VSGLDGLQATTRIAGAQPTVWVVVHPVFDNDHTRQAAHQAGAASFAATAARRPGPRCRARHLAGGQHHHPNPAAAPAPSGTTERPSAVGPQSGWSRCGAYGEEFRGPADPLNGEREQLSDPAPGVMMDALEQSANSASTAVGAGRHVHRRYSGPHRDHKAAQDWPTGSSPRRFPPAPGACQTQRRTAAGCTSRSVRLPQPAGPHPPAPPPAPAPPSDPSTASGVADNRVLRPDAAPHPPPSVVDRSAVLIHFSFTSRSGTPRINNLTRTCGSARASIPPSTVSSQSKSPVAPSPI